MEKLRKFLNGLPVDEQYDFARRCGTTIKYLRKVLNSKKEINLGENICIKIERESGRAILVEDMRPDVDWEYIRGTKKSA